LNLMKGRVAGIPNLVKVAEEVLSEENKGKPGFTKF
jgi:hypothetical protein